MPRVRAHISSGILVALLSAILGFAVMVSASPPESRFWQFGLIYAAVFAFTCGISLILGYGMRVVLWPRGGRHDFVRSATRQGVLFGFMAVVMLMLSAGQVFNLWSAALLFVIFILIELYVQ